MESCTRPTTANSESDTSSLSPPPESHHGEDGEPGEPGESGDFSNLGPYVHNAYVYYPESGQDAAADGAESADGQTRILMLKLTDADAFVDLFDGVEDMDYEDVYRRVLVSQQALVAWQDEWLVHDKFIKKKEPATTANAHKNPRIPRPTQIGIGYQDELESFMYGYQYQYHQAKVGNQDPENQRYTNGTNSGRELRQRVPTQKAAEADLSSSQESDDGIGSRRRTRGQKAKEAITDVDINLGRGQRTKNNSRIDSESRGHTPVSTVTSKKSRGRPPKSKAGASRLQELQFEEASEYDSSSEPTYGQENTVISDQLDAAASNRPLETTEHWNDYINPDEQASRPGTSDSTMSGASSDSLRNPALRSSARNRRRKNTSDFEDALPSHKRLGGKAKNSAVNGVKEVDLAQLLNEENNAEKTRNTRRGRQEEITLPGTSTPAENVLNESASKSHDTMEGQSNPGAKDDTMHKKQGGRKIVTLKSSSGRPLTPANSAAAKEAATDPLLGTGAQQDGKDGPKYSRASLNMMRRWAAKKQAEALGLPVPKIGRYPKGGSVTSTSNVVGSPDLITSPRPLGGRKRKRDEEERNPANLDVSEAVAVAVEAPMLKKKNRGGRPRKAVNVGPALSTDSAGQNMNSESNGFDTLPSDRDESRREDAAMTTVPKKKGGRPRKKPLEVDADALVADIPAPDGQQMDHQNQAGFDLNNDNGQKGATGRAASPQADQSKNDYGLDTAESVEKSEAVPTLRKSSRVRRQTSAAASSQAGTRRGSKSSQKMTVTPTPGPTQQVPEETVIKQESLAGPVVPKKRGRQQKLADTETTPEETVVATNINDDEPPPPKRRKVIRSRVAASTDSTPAPVADLEETRTTPQDEPVVVQKQGSRKRKTSIQDTPTLDGQSDARATSAEPSLPRKKARKASTEDTPATGALSDTQASSVEPTIPRKKAPGRPRKNANAGPAPGWAIDVTVKAEDVPRAQEPLTTRARSSLQENTAKINTVENPEDGEEEIIDPEPPKKKRHPNWGGRRFKGLSASTAASFTTTALHLDTNTKTDSVEDQAQPDSASTPDATPQELPKKGTWGGPHQKKAVPLPAALLVDMEGQAAEPAAASNAQSRPKRVMPKAIAPIGEMGVDDEEPSNAPSRPKKAIPWAAAPGRDSSIDDDAVPGPSSRPRRAISMKTAPLNAMADNDAGAQPATESITPELKKVEKKSGHGGRRMKGMEVSAMTVTILELIINADIEEDVVNPKVEPDNEGSDSEATAKAKRIEAARASKSAKMSRSMKGEHLLTNPWVVLMHSRTLGRWLNARSYEEKEGRQCCQESRRRSSGRAWGWGYCRASICTSIRANKTEGCSRQEWRSCSEASTYYKRYHGRCSRYGHGLRHA